MTPEGEVQRQIIEYIEASGIYAWRNNTGRRGGVSYGKQGSSDILGILPGGKFLAIEVKGPNGKASLEQLEFLGNIAKNGGVAFIAWGLDDVIKHLDRV